MKPNRRASDLRGRWRSFSLKTLLIAITIFAAIFAWRQYEYEYGTINHWVDAVLADAKANPLRDDLVPPMPIVTPCPRDIPDKQLIPLLMKSLNWLENDQRRTCVLKIIAEQFPDRAHELFLKIASETDHGDLKRNAILLACLFRIESDVNQFSDYLDDENPDIRSAAIDAIGVIHDPSFPMPAGFDNDWPSKTILTSKPPIDLRNMSNTISGPQSTKTAQQKFFVWPDKEPRLIEAEVEEQIRKLMTSDLDADVRAAASRAMLKWTPDQYHLRVAEWGVWINEAENLTLAQSIIEEIPPFVHQAGNSMESIKNGRTNSIIVVTKPIVHITVDQPMTIDLSVRITDGRPWFGYPMPDDFEVSGTTGQFGTPERTPPDVPDELKLEELVDQREGYPWLAPSHTKRYITMLTEVGFRWQSLIVTPEKAKWTKLEPVTEKKYQWWNRLREVPSSWVHSRGESERFLFYDGPTEHPSPVSASLDPTQVVVTVSTKYHLREPVVRKLFFVEVAGGVVSACDGTREFQSNHPTEPLEIDQLPLRGETAVKRLSQILVNYGLSQAEADGLVDCWRPQFFETDGRRLITVFGKPEYDRLCPITVFPDPTEFARVGIVLTEFDNQPPPKD